MKFELMLFSLFKNKSNIASHFVLPFLLSVPDHLVGLSVELFDKIGCMLACLLVSFTVSILRHDSGLGSFSPVCRKCSLFSLRLTSCCYWPRFQHRYDKRSLDRSVIPRSLRYTNNTCSTTSQSIIFALLHIAG
jgi:hypothetical protein